MGWNNEKTYVLLLTIAAVLIMAIVCFAVLLICAFIHDVIVMENVAVDFFFENLKRISGGCLSGSCMAILCVMLYFLIK